MNLAATRLHTLNPNDLKSESEIYDWCIKCLTYFDKVLVIVDSEYFDILKNSKYRFDGDIELLHVQNWMGYTHPLNMSVERALALNTRKMLFQSIEVDISLDDVEILQTYLDEKTLVVGGKLNEKHGSEYGENEIHGWNCPWNTLALWDLEKLALTGFLSVSSGNVNGVEGGIEELATISLLQKLKPSEMNAKLVSLPSLFWETSWTCRERERYHQRKMDSKDERAKVQLEKLNIEPGKVLILE